nr:hypothetical protein ISGA_1956 [Gordonia sp. NB41Y]
MRSAGGVTWVTLFIIAATITIMVTRAYLDITGYPQIGSGSLHIAHALYGGALMTVALTIQWLFIGFRVRTTSVIIGGIGFGLFVDEVGKFVTKTNDYFYHPSADIIYITVLVIILGGNIVRIARRPTPHESLANAAMIAAQGVTSGLTPRRRADAENLLQTAHAKGVDPRSVQAVTDMLAVCESAPDRVHAVTRRLRAHTPTLVRSPVWTTIFGWLMVAVSLHVAVTSALDIPWRPSEVLFGITDDTAGLVHVSNLTYVVLGATTFVVSGFAMIARRRSRRRPPQAEWPLRLLRTAAIAFTLIGGVTDFAQFGFAALASIAMGIVTIAVISDELGGLRAAENAEARAAEARAAEARL